MRATTRNNVALALRALGRFPEAIVQHAQAPHVLRQQREQYREAVALNDLGSTLQAAGRHREAAECHARALETLCDVFFNAHGQARSLDLHAAAIHTTGDTEEAVRAWREAVGLYRQAGSEDAALAATQRITALGRTVEALDAATGHGACDGDD
ncbi:tetratricopeptide repeat protein [Streptomyces sp. NPDC002306]